MQFDEVISFAGAVRPERRVRLVSHPLCPYVQRAVIALVEKDVAHERVYIDLAAKPEWFGKVSPLGKVPVLLVDDEALFESAVICDYLDETIPPRLHPADALERARHRAWVEFGSAILSGIAGFYNAPDDQTLTERARELADRFGWLEGALDSGGPLFAGARLHLVDAVYGPIFRYFDVFDDLGDWGVLAGKPRVERWREALAAHPSVRAGAVSDYHDRLRVFLEAKQTHLGALARAS